MRPTCWAVLSVLTILTGLVVSSGYGTDRESVILGRFVAALGALGFVGLCGVALVQTAPRFGAAWRRGSRLKRLWLALLLAWPVALGALLLLPGATGLFLLLLVPSVYFFPLVVQVSLLPSGPGWSRDPGPSDAMRELATGLGGTRRWHNGVERVTGVRAGREVAVTIRGGRVELMARALGGAVVHVSTTHGAPDDPRVSRLRAARVRLLSTASGPGVVTADTELTADRLDPTEVLRALDLVLELSTRDASTSRPLDVQVEATAGGPLRCPWCHDGLEPPKATACERCGTPHHAECLQERCAVLGCEGAPRGRDHVGVRA